MNLIVSGCSFTSWIYKTWPDYLQTLLPNVNLHQLGHPGAGNYYIRKSVVNHINSNKFNPSDTIVLVMWSGISRRDLEVSRYFIDLDLTNKKDMKNIGTSFFISSGGELGGWRSSPVTEDYFESLYKMTDQKIHLSDTLDNISMLESFLNHKSIRYKFMSYTNNFVSESEWEGDDYSASFCDPTYQSSELLNENWIFIDDARNSLHTFAKNAKMLTEDGFHPTTEAHELFAKSIVSKI